MGEIRQWGSQRRLCYSPLVADDDAWGRSLAEGAALIWGSAIFGFGERECKNENDEIEGLS
jgi:cytochrome c5